MTFMIWRMTMTMTKNKAKPKVSNKEVKEIWKNHKPADRNETYGKGTIDIIKKVKKSKNPKTKKGN